MRFWKDVWDLRVGQEPLLMRFHDFFPVSNKKGSSIHDCWDCESQTWNFGFRRGLFDKELNNWVALVVKLDKFK